MRVIQTNLQVKDTPGMNPAKIAREMADMHANTLVTNVGGIYAWYPSEVKHHHVNEYLPEDFDLLQALIDECHKLNIRVVARFDFSKTDDVTFQQKPRWFTRDLEGKPTVVGKDRFGEWSLLLNTCINAGYRNEELAAPVLREVTQKYDIDGVFFNAPHLNACHCETCRTKYRKAYGAQLPDDPKGFAPDWGSLCLKDNIAVLRAAIREKRPDIPVILYYNLYRDNLNARYATADMICTEPQDVLSLGWQNIPQSWKPALAVRMGRTAPDKPVPFGIVHSCPGMDWRHTGLPPAEYRFWLAQIPANGGQIWHSITGYPDTITDKRILACVGEVNAAIEKAESLMDGASSAAEAVLMWNALSSAEGLAEGLLAAHVQFDLMDTYQITPQALSRYKLAILPEDYPLTEAIEAALRTFVAGGGRLLAESSDPGFIARLGDLFGVSGSASRSESMVASYLRLEDDALRADGFEQTELLAHRGRVAHVSPEPGSKTLATLVPPFAPPDAVGAPPERASLPTPYTDLPMAVLGSEGRTMLLPFQLSMLLREYKLAEHSNFLGLCAKALLKGRQVALEGAGAVQAMLYQKGDALLLHLVNGTGQRPLKDSIVLRDVQFSVKLPDGGEYRAISRIAGADIAFRREGGRLMGTLSRLDAWDMLSIEKIR